jgi:hypothetical protein
MGKRSVKQQDLKAARKSTKAETQKRVEQVFQLRLHGAELPDILPYAAEKGWNVKERQLRTYIARADRLMAEILNRNREQLFGRHVLQRRAIYARCLKIQDYKTALQVLRDEAQLEGMYAPTKISPTTPDGKRPYQPPGHAGASQLIRELRAAVDRHRSETSNETD